jgi:hypothetical protein
VPHLLAKTMIDMYLTHRQGGAIAMFLVTAVGMGLIIVSMAEMASMYVNVSVPTR